MGLKKSKDMAATAAKKDEPVAEIEQEEEIEEVEPEEVEQAETVDEVEEVAEEAAPKLRAVTTTQPASKAVAAAGSNAGGNFVKKMAADGFEGLEVGYYSFINVKLDKGVFSTSEDVDLEEKKFTARLQESKARWAYTDSDDDEANIIYSHDRVTAIDGTPLAATFDEWRAEGNEPTEKKYVDLTAEILDGTLAGEIVVMSISPSSVPRLTGYLGRLQYKGLSIRDVTTEISVGKKVVPKVKSNSFYPWDFKLIG